MNMAAFSLLPAVTERLRYAIMSAAKLPQSQPRTEKHSSKAFQESLRALHREAHAGFRLWGSARRRNSIRPNVRKAKMLFMKLICRAQTSPEAASPARPLSVPERARVLAFPQRLHTLQSQFTLHRVHLAGPQAQSSNSGSICSLTNAIRSKTRGRNRDAQVATNRFFRFT